MNADTVKGVVTTILLALNLFIALLLESHLRSDFMGELVIIFIALILTAGIFFGLWIDSPWAYPLSMIVFAASLVNIIGLFVSTNEFLSFAFGLLINVAGVVLGIVGTETVSSQALETYDIKVDKKRRRR